MCDTDERLRVAVTRAIALHIIDTLCTGAVQVRTLINDVMITPEIVERLDAVQIALNGLRCAVSAVCPDHEER